MQCWIAYRTAMPTGPPRTASAWQRDGVDGHIAQMEFDEATALLEGLGLLGTGLCEEGAFLAVVTLREHGHAVTIGNAQLERAVKASFVQQATDAGWMA